MADLESQTLWPTKLFTVQLDDSAWREELIADLANWQKEAPTSRGRSNHGGGWHSPEEAFRRPAFGPLTDEVIRISTDVFRREQYLGRSRSRLVAMWANVNPRGAHHVVHTHGDSLWAGVYYAQCPPGSPGLVLMDPRAGVGYGPARPHFARGGEERDRIIIPAEPGKLVMFPGWVNHYVPPHDHDEPRIAVSFNIRQILPQEAQPLVPERTDETPHFAVAPGLLSPAECARAIAAIEANPDGWTEARVGENQREEKTRNGDVMFLGTDAPEWEWLYERIAGRAAEINSEHFRVDISGGTQPIQIARYGAGEHYRPHTDRGDTNPLRALSCVVALRNAERGGGTSFPDAPAPPPEQAPGDAIFFRGDEPHAAEPVEAGERLAIVAWIIESD